MSLSAVALGIELTALMISKGENDTTSTKNKNNSSDRGRANSSNSSSDFIRSDGSGFLVDLATCFFNRVILIWNLKKSLVPSIISLSSPESLILPPKATDKKKENEGEGEGESESERMVLVNSAKLVEGRFEEDLELTVSIPFRAEAILKKVDDRWERGSDEGSDSNVANADVIDPLAYKIPCPRSSGGLCAVDKKVGGFFILLLFLNLTLLGYAITLCCMISLT